ncbi:hypothetical protein ACQ4PT_012999 [Festuca glaucescens]
MDQWFTGLVAGLRALLLDFPGTAIHGARKCRRKLNVVFRDEVEARKNMANVYDDVMSGFMEMEDEQGKKLSEDEVVDNIVSTVVAGYESTVTTIMWATYHLAKSPNALANLREENVAMSETKGGSYFISHDDIPKMKYTAKVVEETIRMVNIASMVPGWRRGTWSMVGTPYQRGGRWELLNPNAKIDYLPHPKPVYGATMRSRKLARK